MSINKTIPYLYTSSFGTLIQKGGGTEPFDALATLIIRQL